MNTDTPMYEWALIPWRKLERQVFKLQKRIYQASSRGDVKRVHKLQKLLISSWAAKSLAVRRVTQDNQGKKTAGVDGVKSLSPEARLILVNTLKLGSKASSIRRLWIPKPGTDEKRPLGIPTIKDRAKQALVKMALEPEWEAKFEPNSYGFRPGRSCHDAIAAIFLSLRYKSKYVLDADISRCFDCIDHYRLLTKLNTYPTLRKQIRAWLKASVKDKDRFSAQKRGTPQGGIISPLLANIALHGLENRIKNWMSQQTVYTNGKKMSPSNRLRSISIIRYADDLVILHKDEHIILQVKEVIETWLNDIGLELKPSKTRIIHTLDKYHERQPGFDFLGFTVRQNKVGKYTSGRQAHRKLLGFKTIITPSKVSQKRHYRKVAQKIDMMQSLPQSVVIAALNPIIRGWCNYFSTVVSKKVFSKVYNNVFWKLVDWGIHRHPKKSKKWIASKYFRKGKTTQSAFACFRNEWLLELIQHPQTPIRRHVKVQGSRSPYDGDWSYWSTRLGQHPELPKNVARLLKIQSGKCAWCKHHFRDVDLMEVDHIVPRSKGGSNAYSNLQLLHRHCHDQKTTIDGSLSNRPLYVWKDDMLIDSTCL